MFRRTGFESNTSSGFSLVEVLCALAIASMAMVALLRGMGSSQVAAYRLDAYLGARIIAQSIVEDELSSDSTSPDRRQGKSGMYDWRFVIEPTGSDGIGRLPGGFGLYRLAVEVTWEPRGRFALETLKLAK